jgi:hypothetical protein
MQSKIVRQSNMTIFTYVLYSILLLVLGVFSYGFIDPNMTLSTNPLFLRLDAPLVSLVYYHRPWATVFFASMLALLWIFYGIFLLKLTNVFFSWKKMILIAGISSIILVLSYPALSYDLFNYMTTAKVMFHYHENPYLVMPTEIPNEPYLAFTRAANKYALYGPVWLFITAIPYYLGRGSIWGTIIAFKVLNSLIYIGFAYFVYKVTKSLKNAVFFAFNPLILIEVLLSGHNDIYMMILVLFALLYWQKKNVRAKWLSLLSFFASWWVKGATVVLIPLFFIKKLSWEKTLNLTYWLLFLVFVIIAPLREELYPWYAVWLVMTASLMSFKNNRFLIGLTVALSFALELRHLPYMWMGYYEGPGPILRSALTVVPVVIYLVFYFFHKLSHTSS